MLSAQRIADSCNLLCCASCCTTPAAAVCAVGGGVLAVATAVTLPALLLGLLTFRLQILFSSVLVLCATRVCTIVFAKEMQGAKESLVWLRAVLLVPEAVVRWVLLGPDAIAVWSSGEEGKRELHISSIPSPALIRALGRQHDRSHAVVVLNLCSAWRGYEEQYADLGIKQVRVAADAIQVVEALETTLVAVEVRLKIQVVVLATTLVVVAMPVMILVWEALVTLVAMEVSLITILVVALVTIRVAAET